MTSTAANGQTPFVPKAVADFEGTGLSHALIESLILKFLVNIGHRVGATDRRRAGLAVRAVPGFPPPAQEPTDCDIRQLGDGQRLYVLADRQRPNAG